MMTPPVINPTPSPAQDATAQFVGPVAAATSRPHSATTFDKVALASLSAIDFAQTSIWLHKTLPQGETWKHGPPFEMDPILGKHPSMLRMAVTGIVVDSLVLRIRSPFLRRFAIGLEAANVGRNFTIKMSL